MNPLQQAKKNATFAIMILLKFEASKEKWMNYITATLIDIYKERFADDKSYLAEKLEELEQHENKWDGLNFLCSKADRKTREKYAEKTELTVEEINFLSGILYKL
jgi:site-specific DNA-adenine methylase